MSNKSLVQQVHEADEKVYTKLVSTINEAIKDRKILAISYKDSKGIPSLREIEPMEIKEKGGLFAWCLKRNDVRHFKITSIVDVKVTDKIFEKREFEKKVKEDEIA
jgi:predicted DNA-binding transcriptional regulator YafY